PVFALAYVRHVDDRGEDLELTYTSPLFERALIEAGVDEETRQEIVEEVVRVGSCQHVEAVPDDIRHTFVVAADITPEEHIRMQAAIQAFVDNSISKTCNFPESATSEDVARAYKMAWELGCKGLTVYVTGSREKVVLETKATKEAREQDLEQPMLWHESKKPRAAVLKGQTHRIKTPLGTTYVTINTDVQDQPFEVFIQTSKAGTDTLAVADAIGRLISYVLRLSSPVEPKDRLKEVVRQLEGIGSGRPLGFGANRVLSLPDGVAQVLQDFLEQSVPDLNSNGRPSNQGSRLLIGDLCPECGDGALVNEEGCRKCYACGFSEC
ncbi:MAG: ribonucleoside-diphosphate reductase, adenosylcobalamin-dependent, partial [Chloroflexota bacterium]